MKNNIATLSIREVLGLGRDASDGAEAIGSDIGLAQNKPRLILEDYEAADDAVSAVAKVVADRVKIAEALAKATADARTFCFRAKEVLAPHLGERHSSLYRPTGFVTSLRVPTGYDGLFPLVGKLKEYFEKHPDQTNDKPKVNVTPERADELHKALKETYGAVKAQDGLIKDALNEQKDALATLRARLQGLCGELKQLIGPKDHRWHRFGLNVPAEPQTPPQPANVEVNSATPGQVLVSCATVPYAKRYRFFIQKVGVAGEPAAVGGSSEPLFVVEHLDAGGRYNLFVSAVNRAGNEGPKSKVVVADVVAKAA